ncbi:MAG: hypothetical protein NTU59_10755, partial [Coprothermobacterota bacterium]|nr:hypothetical protein [Coprothermobacterota bacterium]
KISAFRAETKLPGGSAAIKHRATGPILAATPPTAMVEVITAGPAIEQAGRCQQVSGHDSDHLPIVFCSGEQILSQYYVPLWLISTVAR